MSKTTISVTFGDMAENHVGMQKIGELAENGFSLEDLQKVKSHFEKKGCEVEMVELHSLMKDEVVETAYVLFVRKAVDVVMAEMKSTSDEMFKELMALEWDKKAKMYGRVVNKHARYNLCFGEKEQEPNYEEGKGRIVEWWGEKINHLAYLKLYIDELLEDDLQGEGNLYYDVSKCGIGWHGDAERKKVLAIRLGESMDICWRWYYKGKIVSEKLTRRVNHGEL